MESMVIRYSITVKSIVWRLIASVVFFWSIFQVLSYDFVPLAFYVVGLAYFSHQVLWWLWKGIPCTKTLVINKEDNDG
jgi:hypothetical protein